MCFNLRTVYSRFKLPPATRLGLCLGFKSHPNDLPVNFFSPHNLGMYLLSIQCLTHIGVMGKQIIQRMKFSSHKSKEIIFCNFCNFVSVLKMDSILLYFFHFVVLGRGLAGFLMKCFIWNVGILLPPLHAHYTDVIDQSSRLRPRRICEQEHVGLSNAFLHSSAARAKHTRTHVGP